MIVPMKKICLLVQDKSHDEALKKLRAAGVVHLEKRNTPLDANSSALKRKTKVEEAIGLIQDYKVPKKKPREYTGGDEVPSIERREKPKGLRRGRRAEDIYGTDAESPYSVDAVKAKPRPYLPDLMNSIGEERKQIKEKEAAYVREVSRIQGWEDFDPSIVEEISKTIPIYLYEMPSDAFNRLDKDFQYIKVKSDKSVVRILVPEKTIPGMAPFQLPQKSLNEYKKEIEELNLDLQDIDKELESFADRRHALQKEMELVEYDLEFESAAAGLSKVEDVPEDFGLCWLTGYVPEEDLGLVKKVASENGWALSAEEPPQTDESVPTKLKNNKFVQLLTPITGFLDINPGYREVDISPIFLTFFCIFFAMLFGDAAYGLIITTMAIIGMLLSLKNKKPVGTPLKMLLLLGALNVVWGVLTCSWFAMDNKYIPDFLKDISLSYFSTAKTDDKIVSQNLQIFCFSLAVVHLMIAHIVVIFKCKSLKILGELGTIGMLLGMYNVVLNLIVSNATRHVSILPIPITVYLIGGGFVLSFIFSPYEGSILKSVLNSCQNFISVILGVVNVFSDIMSYIRLWAVGLAGAAIAQTINGMAGPMLGSFLIFAGIILLVFGHGLNMVLNVLSVLVHGVRLNTLEFSGHVGLTWSGTAYKPFKEKEIK